MYKIKLVNGAIIKALLPNFAPGKAELFKAGATVKLGWRHDAGMFLHE